MKRRFETLDAFRGLCALFVVVFHMKITGSISDLSFFKHSDLFVEFFFVLSGFVLTHGYGFKQNLRFKSYIKSRFFRIFPLHIVMLLVVVFLEFGKLLSYKYLGLQFNNIPFSGQFDIKEFIPNLLLLQSWLPFTDNLSFNFPSWSISVEFYLYILFFLSVYIFKSGKEVSWITLSFVMLFTSLSNDSLTQVAFIRGITCFFLGASTYSLYKRIPYFQLKKNIATIIEFILLTMVFFLIKSEIQYKSILSTFLFCSVILFFSFEIGYLSDFFKKSLFTLLGKLSYSIYLTHASILFCFTSLMIILQKVTGVAFAPTVDGVRSIDLGNVVINNIACFIILFTVILVSKITYKYIELNGINLGKKIILK
ncbi:acyltransferase family protein [Providencia rettgeri]